LIRNPITDFKYRITLDSALFLRAPKNSDLNILTAIKRSAPLEPSSSPQYDSTSPSSKTALISYTVHNRLTWGHNLFSRSSQHALLATQTLNDLFEVIPCSSNEIPNEMVVDGEVVGFEPRPADQGSSGCVICIEGMAYGDGMSEDDYAE
jgi:snRNA-activating protein complex subunit 3